MAVVYPIPTDRRFLNLTGQRFGRLTVLSYAGRNTGSSRWNCVCDCGNVTLSAGSKLRRGGTKSCGCLSKDNARKNFTTHGYANRIPEYCAWKGMRQRCYEKTNRQYPDYGGRGIIICERWHFFGNFLADMGPRPSPDYSIDRRDNNGNYKPSNCRWATREQQQGNKRNTRLLTYNGKTMCLKAWARELGLEYKTIYARFRRGRPVAEVLAG